MRKTTSLDFDEKIQFNIGGNIGTGPSKNCFYSNDLFLKEDFGGPVETKDLTSRLSGFSGDIWERGSYTKGTENGRYRSDNYTLIRLNVL